MEPIVTDTIKVEGSLDGQKVLMGFDENSIEHIMSVLTDLYSDPEMAVIREYSTNAWDSHIEAGITKPIEIVTPTSLSPYFRVKDFGVGLSVDDITNIYSKYGASTKRGSNDQVGMLGLGCKSALTYSPQFNVISVKNGVKVHVSVSRIETGRPVMEIVDTVSTNEPNGVEIVIPVKNYNQIEYKARNFFKYWPENSVLINGKPAERFDGREVCDGIYVLDNNDSTDYIVMGNVAYPTKEKLSRFYHSFSIIAYVPIGSIQFTPSREELHYTSLTKNTIENIKTKFDATLKKTVSDEISNASTHSESLKIFYRWVRMLGNIYTPDQFEYKGEKLPKVFEGKFTVYDPSRYRWTTSAERYINWQSLVDAVIIYGYNLANLTSNHKAKIKQWSIENKTSVRKYVLCETLPGQPWTNDNMSVSWDDIATIKLPRQNRPAAVTGGTVTPRQKYEVLGPNGYRVQTDKIDTSKDIYYYSPTDVEKYVGQSLTVLFPNATLVVIAKNRWDKFKRDFPTATPLKKALEEAVNDAFKSLTEYDLFLMTVSNTYSVEHLKVFNHNKIDDPELRSLIENVKKPRQSASLDRYRNLSRIINTDTDYGIVIPQVKEKKNYLQILQKYPLMDRSRSHIEHVTIYINAVYAIEKESKTI